MSTLLISTYDLGRQPFGLASAAGCLRASGVDVLCADLAKEQLSEAQVRDANVVAFFLPMHTATRLALPIIDRVRAVNPDATLMAYGLYAPLNEDLLRERGVSVVLGGEFEDALVAAALDASASHRHTVTRSTSHVARRTSHVARGTSHVARGTSPVPPSDLPRVRFHVPDRSALPPLTRYATLQVGADRRVAGSTEASRGCKHRCRHCPVVPVYDGRFRVVPLDVVMADLRAQVAAGAEHITFGDPDFFNGIGHAARLVRRFAAEWPGVSYDVTIKIEHLLQYAHMLPILRETGCAFVTSAVESVDDAVLARLEKGHTRADFERTVDLFRAAGLTLAPTFVAFTPWTTLAGYRELLATIDRLDVVDHVAPIQLTIRLLVPFGSRMLELDDMRRLTGSFDPVTLAYPWKHPDPQVDDLQAELAALVGVTLNAPRREVFGRVWARAHKGRALMPTIPDGARPRATIPYLNEPWYC